MVVEVAAKIENDFLFESVVQNDPNAIRHTLNEKCRRCQQSERQDQVRFLTSNCLVDHPLRDGRKDDDHQGGQDGEAHRSHRQAWVSSNVSENS